MPAEHENELLFRELLDAAPDPIVIVNEAGAIVHVNARVEEMLGYARAELLGERVEILIPERFAVSHRVHRGDYIAAPTRPPDGLGAGALGAAQGRHRDPGRDQPRAARRPPTACWSRPRCATSAPGAVAEQKNRELAAILESAADAVIGWSLDGKVTTWNRGAERIYGYAAEEMIGAAARHPRPARRPLRAARDHAHGSRGRPGRESRDRSGCARTARMIDVSLSAAPILDRAGEVVGVSTSARDITEQRQAQQRLAESARHFELIQDLVATCGYDGYFKVINGAWEQVLGWTDEQLLPNPFIEIVHPDDRGAVEHEVAKLAAGGVTADFKIRVAASDGRWVWTEWSAVPDPDPELRPLPLQRARDLRAHARPSTRSPPSAASSPTRSRSPGSAAGSSTRRPASAAGPISSTETTASIPAARRRHRRSWSRRSTPRTATTVLALLEEIETEPRSFEHSYRVVLANGTVREIAVEGRPFVAGDGSTRMIGTSRDVTAERAAERLKDEFFQLVSHELRTPLTSIVGYAELLAEIEAENLSPEGRRFVEVIERNSKRELNLVGDLLMLTRITAGTFEIELGEADLGEIARATAEAMGPDAAQRRGDDLARRRRARR